MGIARRNGAPDGIVDGRVRIHVPHPGRHEPENAAATDIPLIR